MRILAVLFLLLFTFSVDLAQTPPKKQEIMPLSEVTPGMKGKGLTVFSGTEPQEFDFIVMGVDNKSEGSFIRVELSGGPNNIIKETNIIAGMSGSPLYVGDKIIGSIKSTYTSSKIPYAFVTPIERMLDFQPVLLSLPNKYLLPPLSVTSDKFKTKDKTRELIPGGSYSTCYLWGDINYCGTATVTFIDEEARTFYAQGHAGSSLGVVGFPVFKSRVYKSVPRMDLSLKDTTVYGPMIGTVVFDGQYGQIGKLDVAPRTIPAIIRLKGILGTPIEKRVFMTYHLSSYLALLNATSNLVVTHLDASQIIHMEMRLRVSGKSEMYFTGNINEALKPFNTAMVNVLKDPTNPEIEGIDINIVAKVKEPPNISVKLAPRSFGNVVWSVISSLWVTRMFLVLLFSVICSGLLILFASIYYRSGFNKKIRS